MPQKFETSDSGSKVLGSEWMGLSDKLVASFYQVKKDSQGDWQAVSGSVVKAPLTESNMEIQLSWQSPFENAGADKGMPTISAMLQSGALQPFLSDGGKSSDFVGKFEGRTGITKLNSIQVFTGMPPVKIQVTALFRAWLSPQKEVEDPAAQLMAWALPESLAKDGAIMSAIDASKKALSGDKAISDAAAEAFMPSKAPICIAMNYKGRTYSPLVIESIGMPINSPIDATGRFTELSIPMTLCTLAAFDRADWAKTLTR